LESISKRKAQDFAHCTKRIESKITCGHNPPHYSLQTEDKKNFLHSAGIGSEDGSEVGVDVGVEDATDEGSADCISDGPGNGFDEGLDEGPADDSNEGSTDGIDEGFVEGSDDGLKEGFVDGISEGPDDGFNEGSEDGASDGINEGLDDGWDEGFKDGASDGANEGADEGSSAHTPLKPLKIQRSLQQSAFSVHSVPAVAQAHCPMTHWWEQQSLGSVQPALPHRQTPGSNTVGPWHVNPVTQGVAKSKLQSSPNSPGSHRVLTTLQLLEQHCSLVTQKDSHTLAVSTRPKVAKEKGPSN